VEGRGVGPEGQGLADEVEGLFGPAALGGQDAEQVPGVGVGGVGLQDRAIEVLGPGQVACPVVPQSICK
jgi:hypothetical protein